MGVLRLLIVSPESRYVCCARVESFVSPHVLVCVCARRLSVRPPCVKMGSIVGLKSVLVPGIYTFLTSDMFIFLPKPPGAGRV